MTTSLSKPSGATLSAWTYLTVSLVAFLPCLLLDKAYFANDLLHQYSHFRALLRSQLFSGHFPLWNPYFLGGQPFFADPNVMMAYPVNYPTLLFPVALGFGVFYCLHLFLAAWGMHLWLKALRLSEDACRVGALTFALSGFFWWELVHPPILAAYAWFPWLLACLERFLTGRRMSWAFAAGAVFGLIFTAGNFQSTTCILYTALGYFIFRLLVRPEPQGGESGPPKLPFKKIVLGLIFALWGGAFLALHLFPAEEFSKFTNRRDPGQTYENFQGTFSMRPSSIYEFLLPGAGVPKGDPNQDTLEKAIQGVTDPKTIDNAFLGAFGYLGIWAPFLAFFAFSRKDRRLQWFLLGGALAAVVIAWGRYFPLHRLLCSLLPGVDLSRAPFRTLQTYDLFLAALVAFGYQGLQKRFAEGAGPSSILLGAAGYGSLLLVVCLPNPLQNWVEGLALLAGGVGLYQWRKTGPGSSLGKNLFAGALLFPLLFAGWARGYSLGPASNFDLEKNFPAFTILKACAGEGRFHFSDDLRYPVSVGGRTLPWTFPQDAPLELGLRASGGYNPIFLKQASALRALPMGPYFKVMAVQGLLIAQDPGPQPGLTGEALPGAYLLKPSDPVGMVTAPVSVLSFPQEDLRMAVLSAQDFDPRVTGILSDPLPPGLPFPTKGEKPSFQFERVMDEANQQAYKLRLDRTRLVVFSEVNFPGWTARLDGNPAPLLTANQAMRAVVVPPGEHRIEFLYRPSWAKPLLLLALLWTLSAIGYGLFLLRTTRKRTDTAV